MWIPGTLRGSFHRASLSRTVEGLLGTALSALVLVGLLPLSASAAASLTIVPISWNVVGLDSNSVNAGANEFAIGARVCNTGNVTATNVATAFVWDTANTYVNLTGSSALSTSSLAPAACFDFYYNVVVTRNAAAYDTVRGYHITATADGLGVVSTPTPRELYVEHLVSQNRNAVDAITGPGGIGDPPATTVLVGQIYTYKLFSHTATNGYEQLASFLDFPNVIFQVLSVNSTYTKPTGATNDKIYADACGWDNVPSSASYRSCIGPENYTGGKAGGDVVTTYTVKILSTGTTTIAALIYDFSGSSYHYNADFGVGPVNSLTITAVEPQADLSVAISDTPDPVTAGNQLTYIITAANAGPQDAAGTVVSVPVPAGTDFVSATGGGTESAGTVTWNLGTIAAGGSQPVTMTVAVHASRQAPVSAPATATTTTEDPNAANNTATASTTVVRSADLSLSKTDDVDPVTAGEQLTYTLQITNAGPSDAQSVVVTDPLPVGTTFVSATGGGTESAGTVAWNLGTLAPGSTSVDVTVSVDPAQTAVLANSASVSSSTSDPAPGNNGASQGTGVGASADLSVTKTDGVASVVAGTSTTYTITVSNAGPSTVPAGVVLTDLLPADTSGSESEADCAIVAGTLSCTTSVALSPGGSVGYDLTLDVAPDAAGPTLINSAGISSSPVGDPDPSDDTDTDTDGIDRVADLSVSIDDAPDPSVVGGAVTYTVTVANAGPSTAPGATSTIQLPAGATYVGDTPSQGSCSLAGSTLTCALGDMDPATSATISVQVDPTASGTLVLDASVSSAAADPDPTDDTDTESTAITDAADLSIAKTGGPDPVVPGTALTYTITVTNDGPSDAANVVVTDPVPAGTSFASADQGGSLVGSSAVWNLGTVASGSSATLTLVVDVDPSRTTDVVNTAQVDSTTGDQDSGDRSATAIVAVDPRVDLAVSIGDSPDPVQAGQDVTYTVSYSNLGPSDATGVVLADQLPVGTTFDSASAPCIEAAGVVTCGLGTIPAGASGTATFRVTTGGPGSITDGASALAAEPDVDPLNDSDTEDTTVVPGPVPQADLGAAIVDAPDPVSVGQQIVYSLDVTNAGPDVALGAQVAVVLPAGTSFVSASAGCSGSLGTVTCSLGDLPSGAWAPVSVTVTATAPGIQAATATVSSGTADPNAANDVASTDTSVGVAPTSADLSLSKSDGVTEVVAGTSTSYLLTLANAGPDDAAAGVIVTDMFPIGLAISESEVGCDVVGQTVTCTTTAPLAVGASTSWLLSAAVPSDFTDATIANSASITTSPTTDPDPTDDTAVDTDTVTISADVWALKTAVPGPVATGSGVTYTIIVGNDGPSTARGVVVTDPLPAGMTFVSADAGGIESGGAVTWNLGDLDPAETVTLTLVTGIDPSSVGTITNTASVGSDSRDPDPSDDSASVDIQSQPGIADLELVKTTTAGTVKEGDRVTYAITLTNQGPGDATGVIVKEELPSDLELVSAAPDTGTFDLTSNLWSVGDLSVGATATLLVEAVVKGGDGQLVNGVSVIGMDQSDPDPANDEAEAAVDVLASRATNDEDDQEQQEEQQQQAEAVALTGSEGVLRLSLLALVLLAFGLSLFGAGTVVGRTTRRQG